jgi:preprotein translocase subunit YajC
MDALHVAAAEELDADLIFLALIILVFYFLMIRPQKKKEKERQEMLSKIQKGDRVVTIGGIHGEVESVKEKHVILLVDPDRGTTLKMSRSAVHNILTKDSDDEPADK